MAMQSMVQSMVIQWAACDSASQVSITMETTVLHIVMPVQRDEK